MLTKSQSWQSKFPLGLPPLPLALEKNVKCSLFALTIFNDLTPPLLLSGPGLWAASMNCKIQLSGLI